MRGGVLHESIQPILSSSISKRGAGQSKRYLKCSSTRFKTNLIGEMELGDWPASNRYMIPGLFAEITESLLRTTQFHPLSLQTNRSGSPFTRFGFGFGL